MGPPRMPYSQRMAGMQLRREKYVSNTCLLCGAMQYCAGAVTRCVTTQPSLGVSSLDLGRRMAAFFLAVAYSAAKRRSENPNISIRSAIVSARSARKAAKFSDFSNVRSSM